ncbi:MAG: bifunctional adenosylcobinamide kinase/adenosylcobinamide-phosphate guanylyltransferase [Gaiellales bacterium]|nr:MAG: bifunctional adenosylcobinamide kinase/adenosylcobinamide-phosphate guanylyltransferase [Gaiellales bacterium]
MIFVTGGARSGKSAFAERLAQERDGAVTYIATAAAGDEEMRARIAEHRRRRPESWRTVELDSGLAAGVESALAGGGTVLVDCLTVYISNRLLAQGFIDVQATIERIEREVDEIAGACAQADGSVIVVSNEVGMGIVPGNSLSRAFRDIAGRANQRMAAGADEVYLCVSGIPVKVK